MLSISKKKKSCLDYPRWPDAVNPDLRRPWAPVGVPGAPGPPEFDDRKGLTKSGSSEPSTRKNFPETWFYADRVVGYKFFTHNLKTVSKTNFILSLLL